MVACNFLKVYVTKSQVYVLVYTYLCFVCVCEFVSLFSVVFMCVFVGVCTCRDQLKSSLAF